MLKKLGYWVEAVATELMIFALFFALAFLWTHVLTDVLPYAGWPAGLLRGVGK